MPRPIVLGNGKMLVNFDINYNLRDLYYPYVGLENHMDGQVSATGAWNEGKFSWLGDPGWEISLGYRQDSLVSHVEARNPDLGLELVFNDTVHFSETIFLRKIVAKNLDTRESEVRLFFNHDLSISGTDVGDTAFFDPLSKSVIHYKRNRYFLINGICDQYGIWQYTTGIKRFGQQEGTWRDAEDGQLTKNPIAQGSVDSTLAFKTVIPAGGEKKLYLWLIAGESLLDVQNKNYFVINNGPLMLIKRTEIYWRNWVNKISLDFYDLPAGAVDLYRRSLLTVRTQMDNRGAVLAANDTDIMVTNRDHYSYTWPRDGALTAYALMMAGYPEEVVPFFKHCAEIISPGGFMWPKYNPDGTIGSSWHPHVSEGKAQLPIQEDETALVIWALWEYYKIQGDINLIRLLYDSLIRPAADFLAGYRDPATGLPLESYDLWEERRGIFTFTVAAVFGGLLGAARLAFILGDRKSSAKWNKTAKEIHKSALYHLFSGTCGRFVRGIYRQKDGRFLTDMTLESSLYGIIAFGLLPAGHARVAATMQAIAGGLWVKTEIGGIARYTGDYYFSKSDEICRVPGNPWFITTLWVAMWQMEVAQNLGDLESPRRLLDWAVQRAMPGGLLSEQVHPFTGEPLSVAPLTWSHATYIQAVLAYLGRYRQITGQKDGVNGKISTLTKKVVEW